MYESEIEKRMLLLDMDIYSISELPKDLLEYKVLEGFEGVSIRGKEYFPALLEHNNEIVFISFSKKKRNCLANH